VEAVEPLLSRGADVHRLTKADIFSIAARVADLNARGRTMAGIHFAMIESFPSGCGFLVANGVGSIGDGFTEEDGDGVR
jgi:hypothetical protein